MNKKGIVIFLLIIIGIFGYKFVFQGGSYQGELVPVEDAVLALEEALKNGKPTFLEFTSDNCPACRKAKPWIEEFYQIYGRDINFILVDVEKKGGGALGQELGVRAVPTFIYFNKSGNIVNILEGYPVTNSKEYLEEPIRTLLE
ncbi:MAG: TlpA family protein disulfide reductase [Peptococcales bacterium]